MMAAHSSERAAQGLSLFEDLQSRICARMEALEATQSQARFESTRWTKPAEHRLKGGGHMRLLRGAVFEKAGVNVSHVWGRLSEAGIAQLADELTPFGYSIHPVTVRRAMHLKTGCCYLGDNTLLANRSWIGVEAFGDIRILDVPDIRAKR